jgi:hypothetical protein
MQANYPGVCFDRLPSNGEQATKLEAIMSLSHFHQLHSKRMWFLIFNLSSLAYLRVSGRLQLSLGSICTVVIVLLIMNAIAWASARNFPKWK